MKTEGERERDRGEEGWRWRERGGGGERKERESPGKTCHVVIKYPPDVEQLIIYHHKSSHAVGYKLRLYSRSTIPWPDGPGHPPNPNWELGDTSGYMASGIFRALPMGSWSRCRGVFSVP
jgi:hypothetical protein